MSCFILFLVSGTIVSLLYELWWNRQLCRRFDTQDSFDVYHDCPKPHHAYYGNGKNIMPTLEDPNLFKPAEIQ